MRSSILVIIFIIIFGVIFMLSYSYFTSPKYIFGQAKICAKAKKIDEAIKLYTKFIKKAPKDKFSAEAVFSLAELLEEKGDKKNAKQMYLKLIREYKDTVFVLIAKNKLAALYDYYPLDVGMVWCEGDSETKGKNYYREAAVKERTISSGGEEYSVEEKIYVGNKLLKKTISTIMRNDEGIWSKVGDRFVLLLKFPLVKGQQWTTEYEGQQRYASVVDSGLKIETQAGAFEDCVKIKYEIKGIPGYQYEYYAPEVGKILVTHSGRDSSEELRISELLKYNAKK